MFGNDIQRDYEIKVSEEERDKLTGPLIEAGLKGKMMTNPELFDQFCQIVCGVKLNKERLRDIDIPDNPCKHHTSPFEAIWKMYSYNELHKYRYYDEREKKYRWHKVPENLYWNFAYLSSRGSGKTLYINKPLNGANQLTKKNFEATYAGAVVRQAKEGWRYFHELMNKNKIIKQDYCDNLTKDLSTTKNPINSRISIIVANLNGFNSMHPNTVIIDEYELLEDPALVDEAVKMVKENISEGYPNQMIYISSLKFMSGLMLDIMKNAKIRRFEILISCIFEVAEKCSDERMCHSSQAKDCILWKYCKGILKKKKYSDHYSVDNIIFQMLNSSTESFEMQMLSRLTKPFGTVYGRDFHRDIHVLKHPYEWNPNWETYGARDFGEGGEERDNNIHLLCQVDPNKDVYWFYEERNNGASGGVSTDDLAKKDKELGEKYRVREWFVDKRGTAYISSMSKAGLRINTMKTLLDAYKKRLGDKIDITDDNLISDGITAMKRKFMTASGQPSMFFCPVGCKRLIEDIEKNYKWQRQKVEGEAVFINKASKKHSHAPDACRYFISCMFPTFGYSDIRSISDANSKMPQIITGNLKGDYLEGFITNSIGDNFYEKCGINTSKYDGKLITFEGY